ncbi:MAG TPA: helix-hairpin-helix domain-containing protein [Longimicrobium sp.]|nr:helix-hairpin-helix domain-containing protein [Longimicrobium sp.]
MATTRGKGTRGSASPADTAETEPRARRTHTRAPEDEIGGTAAPEAAVTAEASGAAGPARGRGRREFPGAGVAPAGTPAADATTSAPAAKPARGGKKKRETYVETAARRRREKEVDQLQADLRAFALARPSGWNHDDWQAFLGHLAEKGHDVSDHGAIGIRLERERLAVVLEAMEGLGPRRVQSLVDRYQTLWSMRHADPGEVAKVPGMTRPLAERVLTQLRERAD